MWVSGALPAGVTCTGSGAAQVCTFAGTIVAGTAVTAPNLVYTDPVGGQTVTQPAGTALRVNSTESAPLISANTHNTSTIGTSAEYGEQNILYCVAPCYRGYATASLFYGENASAEHGIAYVGTDAFPSAASVTSGMWGFVAQLADQTSGETGSTIGGSAFRVEGGAGVGEPTWTAGYWGEDGCCKYAMIVPASASAGSNVVSEPIAFAYNDSAGTQHYYPTLNADAVGDLQIQTGTGFAGNGPATGAVTLFSNLGVIGNETIAPAVTGTNGQPSGIFGLNSITTGGTTLSGTEQMSDTGVITETIPSGGAWIFSGGANVQTNQTFIVQPIAEVASTPAASNLENIVSWNGTSTVTDQIYNTTSGVLDLVSAAGVQTSSGLTVNGNLSNSNGVVLPSALTGSHGSSGVKVQLSDGTGTSGNLASFNAGGSLTDSGAPLLYVNFPACTTGSASNLPCQESWTGETGAVGSQDILPYTPNATGPVHAVCTAKMTAAGSAGTMILSVCFNGYNGCQQINITIPLTTTSGTGGKDNWGTVASGRTTGAVGWETSWSGNSGSPAYSVTCYVSQQ